MGYYNEAHHPIRVVLVRQLPSEACSSLFTPQIGGDVADPKQSPETPHFSERWFVVTSGLFDTCVGYAGLHKLFPAQKNLYTLLRNGELALILFELPEVLSIYTLNKPRIPKGFNEKRIDLCPKEVDKPTTFGHRESDTVI